MIVDGLCKSTHTVFLTPSHECRIDNILHVLIMESSIWQAEGSWFFIFPYSKIIFRFRGF
jgi:hypothetical protein